jgi:HPt (histidine-containing phosphotransfer) domain-containing protein/glucose-6-phosphate-specific signal transduction histidine kinase
MSSIISAASSRLTYSTLRLAVLCVGYVAAVLLLDVFSRRIERLNSVAAFFPADGLALALLYVFGLRFTPIVFLGYLLSATLLFSVPWPLALGASAAGCALQAGTVALLKRVLDGDIARGHMSDLGKFLLAIAIMAVSGGLLLRFTLIESGDITPQQGTAAFFTICTGLATGALMLASPAALAAERIRAWLAGQKQAAGEQQRRAPELRRLAMDAAVLLGSTLSAVGIAFSTRTREFEPLYLCFIPIIWLALRRGLPGAAVAIVIVDTAVIVAFRVQRLPHEQLDKVQLLQLALSLMGLILGTTVTEREKAQAAARAAEQLRYDVELARRTARSNQELRLVLDTVNEGLLSVMGDGTLAPERSAIVTRWFGPATAGTSFVDYIRPIDSEFAQSFELNYQELIEDVMPVEVCRDQLPTRLRHGALTFEVSYLPLGAGGAKDGLLVVIDDITQQLEAAQHDAEQRELLAAFQGFTRDRTGFLTFLEEASRLVQSVVAATSDLVTQKRLVHTLKGNAAMMGLTSMARLCHQVEDELAENASVQLTPLVRSLGDRWLAFSQSVRAFLGDRERGVVEVPKAELTALCRELEAGMLPVQAVQRLTTLGFEPIEIHLGRLAAQARALSQRLGKGEPDIQLEGRGPRLDPARYGPLFSELVHLVRNAVDHGFETSEERALTDKPSRPRLRLSGSLDGGKLVIEVEDDGRGIDWQAVRRSAVQHGIRAETEAELTAALFAAGVTARQQVSDTSGRGVGMAGVYARVRELGGDITVTSRAGAGTCWRLTIPFQPPPGRA